MPEQVANIEKEDKKISRIHVQNDKKRLKQGPADPSLKEEAT